MSKLYKGYDDIVASDAFKQRMVRTLQNEVSAEAEDRKVVRLPVKRKTVAILIAAAALVLTIGTAVAAGVFIRHNGYTTPGHYMFMSKEEREQNGYAISDVEKVIEAAKPKTVDYSIEMLPEMKIASFKTIEESITFIQETMPEEYEKLVKPDGTINFGDIDRILREAGYVSLAQMKDADEVNAYRVEQGQPVFSEKDWGWLRDIRPEIEEVLTDGSQCSIRIRLNTDHGLAFTGYQAEPDKWDWPVYLGDEQRVEAYCCDAYYTVDGSDHPIDLGITSTGVTEASEDGCSLLAGRSVYFGDDKTGNPFPTEGKVRVTMNIALKDAKVDENGEDHYVHEGGILGFIRYTFEFDAAAARDASKPVVKEIPLSGSIMLMMNHLGNDKRYTERVSLDGVVLEEKLTYQSTGIMMQYTVKSAPESWTEDHKRSLLDALSVQCIPEDEENADKILKPETFFNKAFIDKYAYLGILPVFPSDYEAVREMGYKVRLALESTVSVNGEPVGEDWAMKKASTVWSYDNDGSYTFYYDDAQTDFDVITVEQQTIAEYELQLP